VVAAVVVALVSRICVVFALPTASFGTAPQCGGILNGTKRQAFDIDATDLAQPGSLTHLLSSSNPHTMSLHHPVLRWLMS